MNKKQVHIDYTRQLPRLLRADAELRRDAKQIVQIRKLRHTQIGQRLVDGMGRRSGERPSELHGHLEGLKSCVYGRESEASEALYCMREDTMLIYTERIGNARAKAKAKAKGFQLDYIIKEKTDIEKRANERSEQTSEAAYMGERAKRVKRCIAYEKTQC